MGTEDPGPDTGREKFDVEFRCEWEKHKKKKKRKKQKRKKEKKKRPDLETKTPPDVCRKPLSTSLERKKPWTTQAPPGHSTEWGRVARTGHAQRLEPGLGTPHRAGRAQSIHHPYLYAQRWVALLPLHYFVKHVHSSTHT